MQTSVPPRPVPHAGADSGPRPVWPAVKRGLRGRCPNCGQGKLFRGYLATNESCPACGEAFHHHRADDFPQYITIFVVAHVLVAILLAVDDFWPDLPLGLHYVLWPGQTIVLSLILLPRFKGGLIAYQWALRMHGFEGPGSDLDEEHAGGRPSPA